MTSGMVGAKLSFIFDPTWNNLRKTAVFKAGAVVKDKLDIKDECQIPSEILKYSGETVKVGVCGINDEGTLVIPTIWANIGMVECGADPSGDPAADPSLPIWAELQKCIGDLDKLSTEARENLVAALNELVEASGEADPEKIAQAVTEYLDKTLPDWAKQPEKPEYTAEEVGALPDTYTPPNQTAQQVGADPAGTADTAVSQHNTSASAHNDLRLELKALADRLNAFFDSDDATLDELSEIVEYIKSNKTLIDAVTTSKVSISDIVNDLATNVANKPLSAAQGVVLKGLIDAITVPTKVSQLDNDSGYITDYTETDPTVPSWAKQPAKPSYTATEVHARPDTWMPSSEDVGADPAGTATSKVADHNVAEDSHNDIRLLIEGLASRLNALANSDDTTLDQMAEVVGYIKDNRELIEQITTGKVNVADIVNNLTTNVDSKPLSAAQGVALKALIDAVSNSLSGYQAKGDYALNSSIPTKVSQLQNDAGYLTEHQDISGLLPRTELDSAVNDALAQAKKSGEFDGADGVSPHIGTNGNWFIGTTDTGVKATGADGRGIASIARTSGTSAAGSTDTYTITYTDGSTSTYTVVNGKDGTSVSVSSVSESSEDGGSNVVTFSDGKTLTVKNGKTGATGAPGYTPVKGTDYYTAADKTEMVNAVLAALPTWTGGSY